MPESDFSQLLVFQETAEGLPEVDGVRLERFSDGCATLIINLREPTDLAAALQEAAPLALQQRQADAGSAAGWSFNGSHESQTCSSATRARSISWRPSGQCS